MCGIVGYVGHKEPAMEKLIAGLQRLEYRGYDSAGVAILDGGKINLRRAPGKLANLAEILRAKPLAGHVGIGHTRWATHGKPSERNAHPHCAGQIALVHNGILENYRQLRQELTDAGRTIQSETDTELIAHLIDLEVQQGSSLSDAVRKTMPRLVGSYALGVISEAEPDRIVVAKNGGSPIIIGVNEKASYLASDIPAILPYTREMIFLEDGELAVLTQDAVEIEDTDGNSIQREPQHIPWDPVSAEKGTYDHFMQKEIFEQPRAITDTIGTRVQESDGSIDLDGLSITPEEASRIERIYLVACGTAWHAGLVGKYMIEQMAGIPVEVDLASELRYRQPLINENCWMVPISQSGETADTLAALREGKERGARILSICNTRESTIARESDDVLYTYAGPEIGVASTKAFTTQLVMLYLLALKLGIARGKIDSAEAQDRTNDLLRLPRLIEQCFQLDDSVRRIAQHYFQARDFLYLGRGIMYPIALEGALKLKEISYIHAEGYPAGEMKHGPIALIDDQMPVVVIATEGPLYPKVISNLEVVKARGGQTIAIATEGNTDITQRAKEVIFIPDLGEYLSPILATIPLQLLAYHIATLKGTDVDQPRNLAKSVTVE